MEIEKTFQGAITTNTQKSVNQSYGMTNTAYEAVEKTKVLNDALSEILTEAGVECKYRDGFLWIYGAPFHYTFYSTSANYYYLYGPFNTSNLAAATTYSTIFNGLNYNFKIKVAGCPKTGICLVLSTYSNPSNFQSNTMFHIEKGTHTLTGRNVVTYGNSIGRWLGIGLEDGVPQNIGRSSKPFELSAYYYQLALIDEDTAGATTFPLVRQVAGPFMPDNGYLYPTKYGLETPSSITSAQDFVTISGRRFWVSYNSNGVGLLEDI